MKEDGIVVLLRHAEARKNVEDRHGAPLTEFGISCAKSLADALPRYFGQVSTILYLLPRNRSAWQPRMCWLHDVE